MNPLEQHRGKFTTIESKLIEKPIIGFDTEDDGKGTPLSIAFYGDNGSFYTASMDEAIDYIYNIREPSIFVAHNLEYDIGNLFKHCDYKYIEEMIYAAGLLKVTLMCTKHVFINSSSFFKGSLKKMGDFIGLEKLEGNALSEEYNIRDAEIVFRFMKQFQTMLVKKLHINLGITIGALAMNAYRRSYMMDKKQITYNSPNCLKAYYGGRVEIFYKGAVEKIKVSDINSSYPYSMRYFEYPDTATIEPSTLATHRHGVGKFKVFVPLDTHVPVLPYKSPNGRLFFPVGEFTGWWTYPEIRYAMECGTQIIHEYEGEGTNVSCNPFVNFIDDFYNRRLKAKKSKNKFEDLFYKLFQNNLYGKWCQHKPTSMMSRTQLTLRQIERKGTLLSTAKIGPFYSYTIERNEKPATANYMWGVYVTAYSRMVLHKGLAEIHRMGGTLLYCDTDSIMYSGLSKTPLTLSDKLGDWDEEKFDLGVFRQAKGYLLCNKKGGKYEIEKVACKGVNTDYAYDFIINGMARVTKPVRFKESLIRINAAANENRGADFEKEMGVNVWREVEKQMKSIYIKRLGDKGVTKAVDVKDIPALEESALIGEAESIEQQLLESAIQIVKPQRVNYFGNTKIPKNWFKRTGLEIDGPDSHPKSSKLHYFHKEECLDLEPGVIWFAGPVFAYQTGKYGAFYKIGVKEFRGEKAPPNFIGAFRESFLTQFGIEEKITGKYLAISLNKTYLENSSLNLNIELSDLGLSGISESENSPGEQLDGAELEQLKAADWSSLDAILK